MYLYTVYWSLQTLSTVGYGNFGAENSAEILLTAVWIFLGVAFYTVAVGSFTSMVIERVAKEEQLELLLKSVEIFAKDTGMSADLNKKIRKFIFNNYLEFSQRLDENIFIDQLPATLKEEVLIHTYGKSVLYKYDFFNHIADSQFQWGLLKLLAKIRFNSGDTIYQDGNSASALYLISNGTVKLYAENDYPFAVYRTCASFGDVDILCHQVHNGTAKSLDFCHLYKVQKQELEDLLIDFPNI